MDDDELTQAERDVLDGKGAANSSKALGEAPPHDAELWKLHAYVGRAYGLPKDYRIGPVDRHGGADDTPLTVQIIPPGDGRPLTIRYEEERHCRNAETLRGHAARDTDGLTRAGLIVGKAAPAVYEALCSLANVYDRGDPRALTHEWLQHLRAAGQPVSGYALDRDGAYDALHALQRHPYSRDLLARYHGAAAAFEGARAAGRDGATLPARPRPAILTMEGGAEYVTARHLGVFVRVEMGADRTSDSKAVGLFAEIGGRRTEVQAWNKRRDSKKRLVLVRLPKPPDPAAEEEEA